MNVTAFPKQLQILGYPEKLSSKQYWFFSQFKPIYVPKNLEIIPANILSQLHHCKISHDKYKDVLLNTKCFRHSMNSKNHRTGTYEINQIFLSCFDDKIYILDNILDMLALGG